MLGVLDDPHDCERGIDLVALTSEDRSHSNTRILVPCGHGVDSTAVLEKSLATARTHGGVH